MWRNTLWKRSGPPELIRAPDGRTQILVDVSVICKSDARTGIQRVVRGFWFHLMTMMDEQIIIRPVYCTKKQGYRYATYDFLGYGASNVPEATERVAIREGDIFLGLDLSVHLVPLHAHQLLQWQEMGVKLAFLVYDLLPLTNESWFGRKLVRSFRAWHKFLCCHASLAICISPAVRSVLKETAEKFISQRDMPLKITSIVLGADIESTIPSKGLSAEDGETLARLQKESFILMVGTVEPRKAYDVALSAMEWVWRQSAQERHSLVIVGKPGWKTRRLQRRLRRHQESGKRLFWISGASDELLRSLMDQASFLLSTSRAEGLGLPLLEAHAQGCPVVARNLEVFKEVGYGDTIFYDNDDPASLGSLLAQMLDFRKLRQYDKEPFKVPLWQESGRELVHQLMS